MSGKACCRGQETWALALVNANQFGLQSACQTNKIQRVEVPSSRINLYQDLCSRKEENRNTTPPQRLLWGGASPFISREQAPSATTTWIPGKHSGKANYQQHFYVFQVIQSTGSSGRWWMMLPKVCAQQAPLLSSPVRGWWIDRHTDRQTDRQSVPWLGGE